MDLEIGINKETIKLLNDNCKKYLMYSLYFYIVFFAIIPSILWKTPDKILLLNEPDYVEIFIKFSSCSPVPYEPFKLMYTRTENNINMIANMKTIVAKTKLFLQESDDACVHVANYGIPWDIIVFRNRTMINGKILNSSDEQLEIIETDDTGRDSFVRRSIYVQTDFVNEDLKITNELLWFYDSYCFQHYKNS